MNDDATRWLDATAQAQLVTDGEATPAELLEAAIARIERFDGACNAVIHPLFDKARASVAAGEIGDGAFRGVPFLVKDAVCHTAGDPYHCGMQVLKDLDWHERDDSWLARRFREAGFVICGKTNLPELAAAVTTEPAAYGATHNPWDLRRSPGGSSGGAAAAVASGMVPVAHGNDMGGSIRFPASMCGIVGLKPTRARTSLGPNFGEYWGPLTHELVLTRTVRDTAGVLDAVAGPGTGDPYTAPAPLRPWRDEVGADPGRLRVGFRTRVRDADGGEESHPDCVAAVHYAAALLESLGHHVEPHAVPQLDAPGLSQFGTVTCVGVARDLERWSARTGRTITDDDVEPNTALLAQIGRQMSATAYFAALEEMQQASRSVAAWFDGGFDLLVTPVSIEPPFLLGGASDSFEAVARSGARVSFTAPFDATGQPAMSLPLHWTEPVDGTPVLPIGVQLVAPYGREDVLLRVAAQLEAAAPWSDRHPPDPA